ncbi:MAG: hypothetical protein ACOY4O_11605 [Pseudomonadota bacterium]
MTTLSPAAGRTGAGRFLLGMAAYIVPTFALGYGWHLVWFEPSYARLGIYRPDPIIPFGLGSMIIQAALFAWLYPRAFGHGGDAVRDGLRFGAFIGLLAWSFTTLAVAAKYPMASIGDYVMLETGFTLVQSLLAGLLMAWVHRN